MKFHLSRNSFFLILFTVVSLLAKGESDPAELIQIRKKWEKSLQKGIQQEIISYHEDLTKLQKRLTKSKRFNELDILKMEIENTQENPLAIATAPKAVEANSVPGIKFARTIHRRRISEVISQQNAAYLRSLETLQQRYLATDRQNELIRVTQEIIRLKSNKKLLPKGFAPPSPKNSPLPKSAQELETHLIGTVWNITRIGYGGKKSKPDRDFKFKANQAIEMPWNPTSWSATGPREATVTHEGKEWTFQVIFSDDMKTLKAYYYDQNSTPGSQKKSPRWSGIQR